MEKDQRFNQEQKLTMLKSAKEVGIKEAPSLSGIHYSTIYQWQSKLDALGKEAFLAYRPPSRGRGIKKTTPDQEKAVVETWQHYPGFGPSQIRNQLRRQGITISTRTVQQIMEANGYRVALCEIKSTESGERSPRRPYLP